MSDDKDTDIHKKNGICSGEKIGHGTSDNRIRKKGFFFDEEIGHIDIDGKIKKQAFIFDKTVGQIKGDKAHAEDGIIFSGEEYGYVDSDGNIRQRDGFFFKGRIIGKMKGNNKAAALGYFVIKYDNLVNKFEELKGEVRSSDHKGKFLGRVRSMIDYVAKADVLGDIDGLVRKLKELESEILNELESNYRKKEELVHRAQSLATNTDWKGTSEELKGLQEKWKTIGLVPHEKADDIWNRFCSAVDKFYENRKNVMEKRRREWEQNLSKKERLCATVESLCNAHDMRQSIEEIKRIQAEWKTIGHVERDMLIGVQN